MKMGIFVVLSMLSASVFAGDDTVDAAIGGGVGGAIGAAIGEELGDRNGAIVGGAIGGAVGAAVTTRDHEKSQPTKVEPHVHVGVAAPTRHHPAPHCPPGLAKKGRC